MEIVFPLIPHKWLVGIKYLIFLHDWPILSHISPTISLNRSIITLYRKQHDTIHLHFGGGAVETNAKRTNSWFEQKILSSVGPFQASLSFTKHKIDLSYISYITTKLLMPALLKEGLKGEGGHGWTKKNMKRCVHFM